MLKRTMQHLGGTFREDTLANDWQFGDMPPTEVYAMLDFAEVLTGENAGVYPDETDCGPQADFFGRALHDSVDPFGEEDFDELFEQMAIEAENAEHEKCCCREDDNAKEEAIVADYTKDDSFSEYVEAKDPQITVAGEERQLRQELFLKESWETNRDLRAGQWWKKRCRGQQPKYKTRYAGATGLGKSLAMISNNGHGTVEAVTTDEIKMVKVETHIGTISVPVGVRHQIMSWARTGTPEKHMAY